MNKAIATAAQQLLKIDVLSDMYHRLMGPDKPKNVDEFLTLLNIIVRFSDNPEMKELEKQYDELLRMIPTKDEAVIDLFANKTFELTKRVFEKALQLHSEGNLNIEWPEGLETEKLGEYISIANSQLYYNFRGKLAAGDFNGQEGWPETDISGSKVKGRALLKPENISPVAKEETLLELQKTMRDKVMDLAKNGDLAVDILDIVIAKQLKTTDNPYQPVKITADDFLQARGIKKVLGGTGRRGGYREAWRQEIAKYMYILSDAFLEVAEMEVYEYDKKGNRQKVKKKNLHSRAVVLSSLETQGTINEGPEVLAWYVRPGDCFIPTLQDPNYQTALLSQRALQYDYNKYKYEKRLTRYLHYIARMKSPKERLRVKTLLNEIRLEINEKRPGRTKDRLESALNRLKENGDIASWKYESKITAHKGWLQKWLDSIIIIEMPEKLTEYYRQIKRPGDK